MEPKEEKKELNIEEIEKKICYINSEIEEKEKKLNDIVSEFNKKGKKYNIKYKSVKLSIWRVLNKKRNSYICQKVYLPKISR